MYGVQANIKGQWQNIQKFQLKADALDALERRQLNGWNEHQLRVGLIPVPDGDPGCPGCMIGGPHVSPCAAPEVLTCRCPDGIHSH